MIKKDRKYQILYVEDNLANVKLVDRIFSRRNDIALVSAQSGLDGLAYAQKHPLDLILLDINLPDIDGYEFFDRLRDIRRHERIPVIALTANATFHDHVRGQDAAFFDYITKPIDIEDFTLSINGALGINGHTIK